jgi:RNA polymerase sigma factor (sigma-70 family)
VSGPGGNGVCDGWCEPPEWFEPYFREHYRDLLRVALIVGGARHEPEAEDAVQSVMVQQIAAGRWEHIAKAHPYFSTAVVRAVLVMHRRRAHRPEAPWTDANDQFGGPAGGDGLTVWEDTEWVKDLLSSLPARQRDVMALILDGLSTAEVAELLGTNVVTVRSNLRHARDGLAKQLTEPLPRHEPGAGAQRTEGELR